VLSRAWSRRFIELAALADIILNMVPAISDFMTLWLTLLLLGGTWVARHVAQSESKETTNAKTE
jgi:flagellar biosynthesis component FlhA